MAKVNFGALANDARGSLAGQVFSRNRGGAYTRTKVSPVQPSTPRQLAQRAIFANNSQQWRNLSPANQAAWIAWANSHTVVDVFGNALKLSGIAAFQKVNATIVTQGLPQISVPPPDPTDVPPAATAVTVTAATNTITITLASDPTDGQNYQIWCTAGLSPGRQATTSDFRLCETLIAATTTSPVAITPATFNPKLIFVAGQNVAVLVVRLSDEGVIIDSTRFNVIAG